MTSRVHIDPKQLDKHVRIETSTLTRGTSGGMRKSWALVCKRWARISGRSGMKQGATTSGGGEVPQATHIISMYYLAGVTPTTHRIVHRDAVYDILHVDDVLNQGVRMDLLCRTGVSNG